MHSLGDDPFPSEMTKSDLSRIESIVNEVTQHHDEAPERIATYYDNPEETKFEDPPHDQIFQQAAHYIELGLIEVGTPDHLREVSISDKLTYANIEDRSVDWWKQRSWVKNQVEDILYGISMELLVSAAHMKIDTADYVAHLIDENKTPHVSKSKRVLLDNLREDLSSEEVDEIDQVLELAKQKRNNLVHFSFHYQGAHFYTDLFVDVGGYLIDRYADTDDIPELETLEEYLNYRDRQRVEAETYPRVSVDFRSQDS